MVYFAIGGTKINLHIRNNRSFADKEAQSPDVILLTQASKQ